MSTDRKVAHVLQVIGLAILIASPLLKFPIFWTVFGMGCLISGTYKLCMVFFWNKKKCDDEVKPIVVIECESPYYAPEIYKDEEFVKSCRSLPFGATKEPGANNNATEVK